MADIRKIRTGLQNIIKMLGTVEKNGIQLWVIRVLGVWPDAKNIALIIAACIKNGMFLKPADDENIPGAYCLFTPV